MRQIAQEVPLDEIKKEKIQSLVTEMKEVLGAEHDGVGLAAPQIGEPLRIFIVSGKAFRAHEDDTEPAAHESEQLVFINPELTRLSKKKIEFEEGCLSTRNRFGQIFRAERATITAYDEHGRKFTHSAGGLLAEIFQHEVDHLNGILFIDSARNVRLYEPDNLDEA